MTPEIDQYFQVANELIQEGTAFVTVTLLSRKGHVPQMPGSKITVLEKGLHWGTIGGGKFEARAIREAQSLLQQQSSDRVTIQRWNLQRDLGMSCGGEAEVLFEMSWPLQAPVVIFGAGHVAQKLVPLLGLLDATVWVVDPRKEWLEKLPITQRKLKTFCVEKYEDFVPQVPPTASVLALTQGHSTDLPVLVEILKRRLPPYVGAIGSSVKASKLKNDLRLSGVPELHIEKLHCPIGLDLGNTQHPGEIALSIAAQWLKDRKSEKYIYAHYAHQNPEPL